MTAEQAPDVGLAEVLAGEVWQEADNVLLLCIEPGVWWQDFRGARVPWDAPLIARPLRRLLDAEGNLVAPVVAAAVREARAAELREAAGDLKRLDRIGKTRRDKITDEDWDWYRSHPLVENQRGPWHIIPPMHKWLRDRADRIAVDAPEGGGQGE